jgi:uncharacterized membrane protein YdjX (TVP38/TMEM64 family)
MVGFGAIFGLAGGFILSLVGTMAGMSLAFGLGRWGEKGFSRFVGESERLRMESLLKRYGLSAMAVTRPIPILSESFAIIAGASSMKWRSALGASLAGNSIQALLYAWAGTQTQAPDMGYKIFIGVLLVSGVFWWLGQKGMNQSKPDSANK